MLKMPECRIVEHATSDDHVGQAHERPAGNHNATGGIYHLFVSLVELRPAFAFYARRPCRLRLQLKPLKQPENMKRQKPSLLRSKDQDAP